MVETQATLTALEQIHRCIKFVRPLLNDYVTVRIFLDGQIRRDCAHADRHTGRVTHQLQQNATPQRVRART
eukprot:COSAG06_NODE_45425_length_355_cov_0.589844_1_plen_70_part_10